MLEESQQKRKQVFLNTESKNHVKGTSWWTNINTKERKRSKKLSGENWKKGMC